ncbi:MAG: glk [Myxococcales bacterium]|nr:glk [Myxococcales bacterium]
MILAGDTGGTKTVLALYDLVDDAAESPEVDGELRLVREQVFACADYTSLEAVLDAFLGSEPVELEGAGFGVAGPVVDQRAKITNLPWLIDARSLSKRLGGISVTLLNDLQATALGTLVLPASGFCVLQAQGKPAPNGTIAVIAPGTGLGEATLYHDGTRYVALPSEGGHADFAPGTDEEIELLRFLRKLHGNHVSYERVLSGAGIGDIYSFLRQTGGVPEPAWLAKEIAAGDRNAVVSTVALAKTDPTATRALEMFAEMLGAEAGNLALRGLATGGVVIGGGIPPKILPALQAGGFLARFNDKGRFSTWARALGVRVALEPRAALYGAAHAVVTSR